MPSEIPSPPGADGDDWTCRDSEDYPLVGRERPVELGGEVVTAEAIAGWLHKGEPTAVTVQGEHGFYHVIDEGDWNV